MKFCVGKMFMPRYSSTSFELSSSSRYYYKCIVNNNNIYIFNVLCKQVINVVPDCYQPWCSQVYYTKRETHTKKKKK